MRPYTIEHETNPETRRTEYALRTRDSSELLGYYADHGEAEAAGTAWAGRLGAAALVIATASLRPACAYCGRNVGAAADHCACCGWKLDADGPILNPDAGELDVVEFCTYAPIFPGDYAPRVAALTPEQRQLLAAQIAAYVEGSVEDAARQLAKMAASVQPQAEHTTYVPLTPARVHGTQFGAALATAQAAALYGTCVTCGGPLGPNDEDVCASCAGRYGGARAVVVMVETAA
jgi:hypothetical protein